MEQSKTHLGSFRVIRNVYLYMVAVIGLITLIIGSVGLINNVLQNYIFQVDDYSYYYEPYPVKGGDYCSQAYPDPTDTTGKTMITPTSDEIEQCREQQKVQSERARKSNIGREFSIALAQILVGLPVWLFHWGIIQKEYKRKKGEEEKS